MNVERLNAWMSFAGQVAVLLGLVALAIEINANTKALRVQLTENSFALQQERMAATAGNAELQALYVKSLLSPWELTPAEVWGLSAHLGIRLESAKRSFHHYKDGVITEASWEEALDSIYYSFSAPFGQLYWSESKEAYVDAPDFVAAVDRRLVDGEGLPNDEWLLRFHARVAKLN
jgi:hypothetical protein